MVAVTTDSPGQRPDTARRRSSMRSRVKPLRGAGAAFVALAVLLGLVLLDGTEQPEALIGIDLGGSPLAGGHRVSLEDATRAFNLPIYRPDLPLAADDTIKGIWMDSGDDSMIYMEYDSGVTVEIRQPEGHASTRVWADELVGDGVRGSVQKIAGLETFVVPPAYPSLGSVRFFFRETLMAIIGDGKYFTTAQLRDLAISTIARADAIEAEKAAA
jgi:hypothetical protein